MADDSQLDPENQQMNKANDCLRLEDGEGCVPKHCRSLGDLESDFGIPDRDCKTENMTQPGPFTLPEETASSGGPPEFAMRVRDLIKNDVQEQHVEVAEHATAEDSEPDTSADGSKSLSASSPEFRISVDRRLREEFYEDMSRRQYAARLMTFIPKEHEFFSLVAVPFGNKDACEELLQNLNLTALQRRHLRQFFERNSATPVQATPNDGVRAPAPAQEEAPKGFRFGRRAPPEVVSEPPVFKIKSTLQLEHSLVQGFLGRFVERSKLKPVPGVVSTGEYWALKALKKAFKKGGCDVMRAARCVNAFITGRYWSPDSLHGFVNMLVTAGIPDRAVLLMLYQPGFRMHNGCSPVTLAYPVPPGITNFGLQSGHEAYATVCIASAYFSGRHELAKKIAVHLSLPDVAKIICSRESGRQVVNFRTVAEAMNTIAMWINAEFRATKRYRVPNQLCCPLKWDTSAPCKVLGDVDQIRKHTKSCHPNIDFDKCQECLIPVRKGIDLLGSEWLGHLVVCPKRRQPYFSIVGDSELAIVPLEKWTSKIAPLDFEHPVATMRVLVDCQNPDSSGCTLLLDFIKKDEV